jgi:uncharacterized phage-associated protein
MRYNRPVSDEEPAVGINDVCDYLILRVNEAGYLNVLKLQKLLYYVQAWWLAIENKRCFKGGFQAWVHGPVSRKIYDRFKDKSMYSRVRSTDIRADFDPDAVPKPMRKHIARVLEAYGEYTDDQLEELTHDERPWQEARDGYAPRDRCEAVISEITMRDYYAARLPE